ncbi:hypothetical protein D3C86_2183730 [compost metagenome]
MELADQNVSRNDPPVEEHGDQEEPGVIGPGLENRSILRQGITGQGDQKHSYGGT